MNEMYTCAREEIKKDARALRTVSPAYAGRGGVLTACLQYVYQTIAIGETHPEAAKQFERIGAEKLRHLQILGDLIVRLGASPVFTACPPFPVSYYSASCVEYSKTFSSMLDADLRLERGLIERYLQMTEELENPAVYAIVSRLLEETRGHLAALERMCAVS